jgi:hypothetical protein
MPPAEFETAIPAGEQLQTHASDRSAIVGTLQGINNDTRWGKYQNKKFILRPTQATQREIQEVYFATHTGYTAWNARSLFRDPHRLHRVKYKKFILRPTQATKREIQQVYFATHTGYKAWNTRSLFCDPHRLHSVKYKKFILRPTQATQRDIPWQLPCSKSPQKRRSVARQVVNNGLKMCTRKQLWPDLKDYPDILMEHLRKTEGIHCRQLSQQKCQGNAQDHSDFEHWLLNKAFMVLQPPWN